MKTFKMYGLAYTYLYYEIKADSEKDAVDAFYDLAKGDYPCSDEISLDDVVLLEDDEDSNE